jgi:subfamily B ATP-binding cassette protein HlyB/CyaB
MHQQIDAGLYCLTLLARYYNIPTNPENLQHELAKVSGELFTQSDIVRTLKRLGLKSSATKFSADKISKVPTPAILETKAGDFVILAKASDTEVLLQSVGAKAPEQVAIADLEGRGFKYVILATKRSTLLKATESFGFSWFFEEMRKYKKHIADVLVASFFLQILALASPLFFQAVVDKVLAHNGLSTLDVLAIGFVVVSIFEVILTCLRTYILTHTANRIDVSLSSNLFTHLVYLPIHYFKSRRVGDTVARIRELENIRQFITGTAITLTIDVFFTLVFFGVMFYYSPVLTLVVLASIPLYVLLAYAVTPVLRRNLDEKFRLGAENQSFMVESITGIETMKSMATEPKFRKEWDEKIAAYVNSSFTVSHIGNISSQITSFISKATTIALLWFGAKAVLDGDLTIGGLIAFNMLAGRVAGPILRLSQLWSEFQQTRVGVDRLGDILNTPNESNSTSRMRLPTIQGKVTFDNLVFRYSPTRAPVINGVSLTVNPGEVIGIVGRSGSGKSTLTKLVQRLYVPESGRVLVDGVDTSLVDPTWLRQQIGVVLQESFLYARSIRENIAISDPGVPDERIIQAAKLAGAHEFIVDLPEGYDTILGEQGSGLSGGQKQRLAIARALLLNPRILIFDEATSALDYESESIIQNNMKLICRGRTVFIIAHRLTAVRNANRIIVMEQGRIVEQGPHEALMEKNGYYKRLNDLQANHSKDGI